MPTKNRRAFIPAAIDCWLKQTYENRELIIVVALALFALPLMGMGLEIFLNGYLDTSPASLHTVAVMNKQISKSEDSTSYYAILDSWREGHDTEKLSISSFEYSRLDIKRGQAKVTTKPGKFGFEWIVSVDFQGR